MSTLVIVLVIVLGLGALAAAGSALAGLGVAAAVLLSGVWARAAKRVQALGRRLAVAVKPPWRVLVDRRARMEVLRGWVEEDHREGWITTAQLEAFRKTLETEGRVGDLLQLSVIHVALQGLMALTGLDALGPVGFITALMTGYWVWALPFALSPVARVATVWWMGLGRDWRLWLFSAVPVAGLLAAPHRLAHWQPQLAEALMRGAMRELVMRAPGMSGRRALVEAWAVPAVLAMTVDAIGMLPWLLAAAVVGWQASLPWLVWAALTSYAVVAARALVRRLREDRLFGDRLVVERALAEGLASPEAAGRQAALLIEQLTSGPQIPGSAQEARLLEALVALAVRWGEPVADPVWETLVRAPHSWAVAFFVAWAQTRGAPGGIAHFDDSESAGRFLRGKQGTIRQSARLQRLIGPILRELGERAEAHAHRHQDWLRMQRARKAQARAAKLRSRRRLERRAARHRRAAAPSFAARFEPVVRSARNRTLVTSP